MKATSRILLVAVLCCVGAANLPAQIVARYDAGLADGPPPVAPDQYEFNGQTWTAVLNTNVDVTVGPVSPDITCVNAWNVLDNSTNTGLGVSYSYPLNAAIHASAGSNGWELTVVSRMVTNLGPTASGFIQFGNSNTQHRFLIRFSLDSAGTLLMQLAGTNGGTFGFSSATNYRTHKIVYSAATGTARYYVNWQTIRSGWAGEFGTNVVDGPAFGVNSDSGKGSMNFNLVTFAVEPPGPVATALRYIDPPDSQRVGIQWNPATNAGSVPIKEYVVYRNGVDVLHTPGTTCVDVYLLPCHRYDFTVVTVDTNNVVYAPSLPFTAGSGPTLPATGVRRVKVVLLNFPDFPDEPFTTNTANDLVFTDTWSVNSYFQEVSYGQLSLEGDSAGWYMMPNAASNYCTFTNGNFWYGCNNQQLWQHALSVLPPDQTNNLSTYDAFLLVFHGVGTVGVSAGLYKLVSATNGFKQDVIIHELGHGLDSGAAASLLHASGWVKCTAYPVGPDLLHPTVTCPTERYGDDFDVMGAANSYHFSMYHKELLGFLQTTNIQVADADGDYVLYAAEIVTNAVQMIKIPLDHEMFYFLEYRTQQGFDGPSTPQYGVSPIDGVLIRLRVALFPGTDGDTIRPKVVLNPGTPFIDPYRGLRVEVTQKLGDRVVINITGTGKPLKITDIKRTGATNENVQLTFDSVTAARYLIQSTTNLFSWVVEKTNVVATSSSTTNALPGAGTSDVKLFRVKVDAAP